MAYGTDPTSYRNTNSIARIRKSLATLNGEESDNLKEIKEDTKDIVSMGIAQFKEQMTLGNVEIKDVADLERLVKLGLLIEGNATEITQYNTQSAVIEMSTEDFEELSESSEFAALREKLTSDLNLQNQQKLE